MLITDFIRLALNAVISHRLRSFLTALGVCVGIAAVVFLTSLGEGIHQFVLGEFTQFGTNIIAVAPGKPQTTGAPGAIFSNIHPLSIDDAEALRHIPNVQAVSAVMQGNAAVEYGRLSRRTTVLGVGADTPSVWNMQTRLGRFLPDDDPRAARAYAVLGSKLKDELFGRRSPLGELIRIGNERYRVIGVMASKGQVLGFDIDDTVYIPTARALSMFDRDSVMEIDVSYTPGADDQIIAQKIREQLIQRHGVEDFNIVTQQQMLQTLSAVLNILTLAVGALGGISLVVGGIGILTIMTLSVNERTAEIGLLRAIGAGRGQILWLFILEAATLSAIGGLAGLILGVGGSWLVSALAPAMPMHTPWRYVVLAEGIAIAIGLLAGVLPARRAARLDPIEALRAE